jgi:hypothetical protein
MKVYEIIAESRSFNEDLKSTVAGWFGKAENKAFSRPEIVQDLAEKISSFVKDNKGMTVGQATAKVLMGDEKAVSDTITRGFMNNYKQRIKDVDRQAINQNMAAYWRQPNATADGAMATLRQELKDRAGITVKTDNATLRQKAIDHIAQHDASIAARLDPEIQKQAQSQAAKLVGKPGIPGAADAAGSVKNKLVDWYKSRGVINTALTGLNLYELYPPWADFTDHMEGAAQDRQAGKLSPEQYQRALDQETGILITKWAELILVPGMISKLLGSPFKSHLNKDTKFSLFIKGASTLAVRNWLNSSDNAKWIAVNFGQFLGNYFPGIVQIFEHVLGTVNPWFPSDPVKSQPDANQGTAGQGTTVDQTSTPPADQPNADGLFPIDPKTGKTPSGRQYYYWDPNKRHNIDVTDWVTGPTPAFIQDPQDHAQIMPKPAWWRGP